MTLNWGKSIVITFVIFMTFIGIMVYKMMHESIELVGKDYYQKEIEYQSQIEKIANTKPLNTTKMIQLHDKILSINCPTVLKSGTITFFRPSDSDDDTKLPLSQSAEQQIDMSQYAKGLWKIKLDWSNGENEFYLEKNIMLN